MQQVLLCSDFLKAYIGSAPLALALERAQECRMYARHTFYRPVLDLGCGDALFASVLFAGSLDVGCDIDLQELSRAKKRMMHRDLIRASALALPFPDASCQTVVANSVLEHIPDLSGVMKEVNRLLKPGGRFYLSVPSSNFDRLSFVSRALEGFGLLHSARRYRIFYNHFWRHYNFLPAEGWEKVARDCGFGVFESQTFDSPFLCTLNDLLVVLALPAFLLRRFTGRWVLWPGLRKRVATLMASFFQRSIASHEDGNEDGGLVFLVLEKKVR